MLRGMLALLFALFIDLLQIALGWGFLALGMLAGTAGGAAAGCAAGSAVAGNVGCQVLGFFGGLIGTVANPFLAPATVPIAVGIGFAISVSIGITMGSAHLLLLKLLGMFYPKLLWGALIEVIPAGNYLPFWTGLTVLSMLEYRKQQGKKGAVVARLATAALSPQTNLGKAVGGLQQAYTKTVGPAAGQERTERQQTQRSDVSYKNFQDVRPRGAVADNKPYAQAA